MGPYCLHGNEPMPLNGLVFIFTCGVGVESELAGAARGPLAAIGVRASSHACVFALSSGSWCCVPVRLGGRFAWWWWW